MFSCCALFSADDTGADMEHLKELDEIDATPCGRLSLSIDGDGNTTSRSMGDTPLSLSPRALAAQRRTEEAAAVAELAHHMPVDTTHSESMLPDQDKLDGEDQAVIEEHTVVVEESAGHTEEAEREFDPEPELVEEADETLRALREAEEAARAAAEEAERRRLEEEESAKAARQAELDARRAQLLAEEAQRAKEEAGNRAAEERAIAQRVLEQEEEMARQQAAEEAKRYVMDSLSKSQGLRLQKHGRNGRTTMKTLRSKDDTFRTLTWGKTTYDLAKMKEVRMGTEADPDHPELTGTSGLRSSKKAHGAMDCSFSLIFPERSLDFTAASKGECDKLVAGFRALRGLHAA